MKSIINNLDEICGRGVINKEYVIKNMKPKVQYILLYKHTDISKQKSRRKILTTRKDIIDGFLFAHVMRHKDIPQKILYIDLVCSQRRKGRALLEKVELLAKHSRIKRLALRSAFKPLIRYYRKHGYKRIANPCKPPSRKQRHIKRSLDQHYMVYDDNEKKMVSGDGWWMSKCI